jgi:glycosyltransferase involved in cell wall biosynthesis
MRQNNGRQRNHQHSIQELRQEIDRLEKENKDLKKLVESKRFKVAWKLATTFNRLFPQNSMRRRFATRTAKSAFGIYAKSQARKSSKYQTRVQKFVGQRPVIIYDSIPWHVELKQRPHHLATQLSKLGYVVIYLERMGSFTFKKIDNNIILVNSVESLAKIGAVREKYFFVSSTNASRQDYERALELLHGKLNLIYEYIDEIDDDISPMIHELQSFYDNLSKYKPTLILASSKKLMQDLVDDSQPKKKLLLSENAVNVEDFNYTEVEPVVPSEIQKILSLGRPVVGYYGALAPWLNADMMNSIAKKRSDLSFVYLGPDYGNGMKKFKHLPNTYFLGPKDYRLLPGYALRFDCAIIPFQYGNIAKATSPVKLFEYMAMGLPTVGTRDLEELRGYKYVYVSKNTTEFEKNLDIAIKSKGIPEARNVLLQQAKKNTWEQRAKDIVGYLKKSNKEDV